jgi:predicted outer membrane repeat protein
MNRKLVRAAARTVALGGVVALGLGSAPAAMAQPADSYPLPCSTGALEYALAHVGSGDTIYLAPGCTYWLTGQLTDNVVDLTIVGEDSTLERAPDASSFTILKVNYTKTLTLDDVNFTNGGGSSAYNGGAIYNHGTLTVNGGTFSDNRDGEYGGAINSYAIADSDASLTVTGAYFTGNGGEYGGAIDNGANSTAAISDSTFSRNSTPGEYGGAVENDGLATITDSSFLGNTSEYGGAIYNDGDLSTADNTLTGNHGYEGGGIYNIGGGGGGPIIPADKTLTGNRGYEGAGIVNDANVPIDDGTLTDDGSLIVYNSAYLGGGIYNGPCTSFTLTGTTIFGNVTDNVYNHGDC